MRLTLASAILSSMKNNEFHAFTFPLRVYYEDTDAGGVVYHSNYLNFMERARTELLRELGYDQDVLQKQLGILFVVRSIQLDYRKAARFNDRLQVITSAVKVAGASVIFQQDIHRLLCNSRSNSSYDPQQHVEGEHLTTATVKVACVDAQSFKPKAIPLVIKGALNREN